MPTIAAGTQQTITLPANSKLSIGGGLGFVTVGNPSGSARPTIEEAYEFEGGTVGPFPTSVSVLIRATQAMAYSITPAIYAPTLADVYADQSGNLFAGGSPVSDAGNPAAPIGRPTRLYMGDSLTQYSARLGMSVTSTSGTFGAGAGSWAAMWAEWECESGAGTLTYDATARTMQWTPLAGAAGPAVDASATGMLYVPGGVAGHGVWIVWFGASTAYTSGTGTVTVAAAGNQVWRTQDGGQGGYAPWAQAYGRQALALAPLPASCPPGMDGYYGLGGANAAHMLAAYPQWSRAPADTAVIELGTNDCAQGVAVADYVRDVLEIIRRLFAQGTRYVTWCTVPPRDTDTTAQRAWKSDATRRMQAAQATMRGRLHIADVALRVTDPASGANQGKWRTSYALDGIHPATAGAMAIGRAIAEIDRQIAVQGPYLGSIGDVYEATTNPSGNILNAVAAGSGVMEGIGGTAGTGAATVGAWAGTTAYALGQPVITGGRLYVATTAGASGSTAPVHTAGQAADGTVVWQYIASGAVAGIATGWTASRAVGAAATVACAKVARTDGVPGDWQVLIAYGASATEAHQLQSAASTTGVVVGGQYALDTECLHILSSGLNGMGSQIVINGGYAGARQAAWGLTLGTSVQVHVDALADPREPLVMSTAPAWPVSAATTTLRALLGIGIAAGGYAVMAFGRTQLRRTA